jgi:hypothetical protein
MWSVTFHVEGFDDVRCVARAQWQRLMVDASAVSHASAKVRNNGCVENAFNLS